VQITGSKAAPAFIGEGSADANLSPGDLREIIEQALLHHLHALMEIPDEYVIHPRIVVTRKSFEKVVEQMKKAKPTKALRDLMRDGD